MNLGIIIMLSLCKTAFDSLSCVCSGLARSIHDLLAEPATHALDERSMRYNSEVVQSLPSVLFLLVISLFGPLPLLSLLGHGACILQHLVMVCACRHLPWLGSLHEICPLRKHPATEREAGVIVALPRRLHSRHCCLMLLLLTVARRRRG